MVPDLSSARGQYDALENAGRLVDHHLKEDALFVELSGQLRIATHGKTAHCTGKPTSHVMEVCFI